MKKLVMVGLMMLAAAACQAESKLGIYAGIEQRYSKLALPQVDTKGTPKEFENAVLGLVHAIYEVKPGYYLFGVASYPFESKLPEYTFGLEVSIYGGK